MEKVRKSALTNRLLAMCMCMTVALMGVQMIPNTEAKGGGGTAQYLLYQGPDVYIAPGSNLITPLCIPKLFGSQHNASPTPEDWCDSFYDVNGVTHWNWVQSLSTTINRVVYAWDHVNRHFEANGSFVIEGNRAYWVFLGLDHPAGWLPLSSQMVVCEIIGWVPKLANLGLGAGSLNMNWVGPMIPFTPDPNPPVPPPPWAPWYVMASQYRAYLKDSVGNSYTGDFTLKMWNRTSQQYMIYYSWNTVRTDFVVFSNTWGFDREHQGAILWLPNEGVEWHTHFA